MKLCYETIETIESITNKIDKRKTDTDISYEYIIECLDYIQSTTEESEKAISKKYLMHTHKGQNRLFVKKVRYC
jgi:hypothetical protein